MIEVEVDYDSDGCIGISKFLEMIMKMYFVAILCSDMTC